MSVRVSVVRALGLSGDRKRGLVSMGHDKENAEKEDRH